MNNAACIDKCMPDGEKLAVLIYIFQQILQNGTGSTGGCIPQSGAGTPVGAVTPCAVGGLYLDISTLNIWVATGAGKTNWNEIFPGSVVSPAALSGAYLNLPYTPGLPSPSNVSLQAANLLYFFGFNNPFAAEFSTVSFFCNATAGLADFGLYSASGALLAHTGAIAPTNAAWQSQPFIAPVILPQGFFYCAVTCNNLGLTMYSYPNGTSPSSGMEQTNPPLRGNAGATAGGLLPANMGAVTGAVNTFPSLVFK